VHVNANPQNAEPSEDRHGRGQRAQEDNDENADHGLGILTSLSQAQNSWGERISMETADARTHRPISSAAIDQICRNARTYSAWLPRTVPAEVLGEVYRLAKLGPTSAKLLPGSFCVPDNSSGEGSPRPGAGLWRRSKTQAAPANVTVVWDTEFYELAPRLFRHRDMPPLFVGKPAVIEETGLRNGSLQGAYFILAARSLGLDCGSMSGFDAAKVNAEFVPDGKWKANILCNLGYGDASRLLPRNPRLSFEEACQLL
jgi:3-hydroxypropanoate dehydrogenase